VTVDEIISMVIIITVVLTVLWDMHKDKGE